MSFISPFINLQDLMNYMYSSSMTSLYILL